MVNTPTRFWRSSDIPRPTLPGSDRPARSSERLSMERTLFELIHDDLDGDALFRNAKLLGEQTDHRTGHVDRCCDLLSPSVFVLLQMIEHSYAHGKRAIFLHDTGVQARELEIGS